MNKPAPVKEYSPYLRDTTTLAIGHVSNILNAARKYAAAAKSNPTSLAQAYVSIRNAHDTVAEELKELSKLVEKIKTETLPQLFEDYKTKNVSVEVDGVTYRVGTSVRATASIKGDAAEAHKWLRDNNLGALIIETVNASTLAATAKTMMETDGKEPDPDLFQFGSMTTTSVTKVK